MLRPFLCLMLLIVTADAFSQNVDYRRTLLTGPFRNPVFWSPFDPVGPPIHVGPGGATDRAIFDLDQTFFGTYDVSAVTGANEQLIIDNDSVRLEVIEYMLSGNGFGDEASVVIGRADDDVGIGIFTGGFDSELQSNQTAFAVDIGSRGSAIIDGAGFRWSNSGAMSVGVNGAGNLLVSAGTVATNSTTVGGGIDSVGTISVSGPDSLLTQTDTLSVGLFGDGMMTVSDGGTVFNADDGFVALLPGSVGAVVVEEAGSQWNSNGELSVGHQGPGTLDILDGGIVTSASGVIGTESDGQGTVTVDGDDSEWTMPFDLIVSRFGDGTLNIFGGTVSNRSADVGTIIGATGTVNVSGPTATWNNAGVLELSNGTLTIEDGGTVINRSDSVPTETTLGAFNEGVVTVDGADSLFQCESLTVGDIGFGELNITEGGQVFSTDEGAVSSGGSFGCAMVTGDNSFWSHAGLLEVGRRTNGKVEVLDGGRLFCHELNIGEEPGSIGSLLVAGTETMASSLFATRVGFMGSGSATVQTGGVFFSNGFVIGHQPGSDGDVDVLPESSWSDSSVIIVGREGTGLMTLQGLLNSRDAFIGRFADGDGTVRVTSPFARWNVSGDLVIGGTLDPDPVSGGVGDVIVQGGSSLDVSGTIYLREQGNLSLSSGAALSANVIDTFFSNGFNFFGGRLHVDTFCGDLDNMASGALAPGNVPLDSSPIGSTTIDGNYIQNENACLELQMLGPQAGTGYDLVTVTGNVNFDGDLKLELLDGFVPDSADSFPVFTVTHGTMTGFFNNVGDNQRLTTADGTGSFLVRYGVTSPNPNQIVLSEFQPEFILGDVNGDGEVNLEDIPAFIDALSSGTYVPAADINQDGEVNLADIPLFVAILAG